MSERAMAFLDRWCNEQVNAVSYPEHAKESEYLAKQCVADAQAQGISENELEEDLTQDLISELRHRLETRTDQEVADLARRDRN